MQTEYLLELMKKYRDKIGGRLYLDVWLEVFPDGSGKLMQDATGEICKLSFHRTEELIDFLERETSICSKIIAAINNSPYKTVEFAGKTDVITKISKRSDDDIIVHTKDCSHGLCAISRKDLEDAEIKDDGIHARTTVRTAVVIRTYDTLPTPNWRKI